MQFWGYMASGYGRLLGSIVPLPSAPNCSVVVHCWLSLFLVTLRGHFEVGSRIYPGMPVCEKNLYDLCRVQSYLQA